MIFGFVKPSSDIHTLGIYSISQYLEDAGYQVFVCDSTVSRALDDIKKLSNFKILKLWIIENKISHLGFSYRLDSRQAFEHFNQLFYY